MPTERGRAWYAASNTGLNLSSAVGEVDEDALPSVTAGGYVPRRNHHHSAASHQEGHSCPSGSRDATLP